jgi:hypothetical protein
MPIPKPRKSEKKDSFIDRCMGNDTMTDEYPENDQRYAVCQSAWRRRNNMSKFLSISVNFTSLGRTEIINGVEHKVYPVTMLVELFIPAVFFNSSPLNGITFRFLFNILKIMMEIIFPRIPLEFKMLDLFGMLFSKMES